MDFSFIRQALQPFASLSPQELATCEDFWKIIQDLYEPTAEFINLEHGMYGILPKPLLEAYKGHIDHMNQVSTRYLRLEAGEDLMRLKQRLAPLVGCLPTELAFTRNATESLNIIVSGIDLQAGEEILISSYDYPTAIAAASQRTKRYGVPHRIVSDVLHNKSKQEILDIFERNIQPHTKLLAVTHLIHYTGQVLPVREITELAHAKGVEVMLDSAHAFAQIDFKVSEIGCDYWIGNLHKWLYAPLTAGALTVRQDKIERVWALLGDDMFAPNDINKFERFSILPMPTFLSIFDAIDFHEALGIANKQARLHYLQRYWASRLQELPRVQILVPTLESGSLGTFSIDGVDSAEVVRYLWDEHKIHCNAIKTGELNAVRVTIQLQTKLAELDKLVQAIQKLIN